MRIVAGVWGGRRIQAPPGREVRPTTDRVREAWMSALHPRLPGARVLELFAGSGALGIECLSRGAAAVHFVERSRATAHRIEANLRSLGAEPGRWTIHTGDALAFLASLAAAAPEDRGDDPSPPFDLALADPPYGDGHLATLVQAFREAPFASELWVEHGRNDPLPPDEAPARQRRYGDTLLSTFEASP